MSDELIQESLIQEGLFQEPPRLQIEKGMRVKVQTIWGSETCMVQDVLLEDGFPMVKLRGARGDVFSISVARVSTNVEG